jgi:hypothetical protein
MLRRLFGLFARAALEFPFQAYDSRLASPLLFRVWWCPRYLVGRLVAQREHRPPRKPLSYRTRAVTIAITFFMVVSFYRWDDRPVRAIANRSMASVAGKFRLGGHEGRL